MNQKQFDELLENSPKIAAIEAALGVLARHLQETQGFKYSEALQKEADAIFKAFSEIKTPPKVVGLETTPDLAQWFRLVSLTLEMMPDYLEKILRAHALQSTSSNPESSE